MTRNAPGMSPHQSDLSDSAQERMTLSTLPYDLLHNVAQHLDLYDIYALQLTSRSLHDFAITRPVYRNLAVDLLKRCRALPLSGFQRLSDLSTAQLVAAVTQATRLESAWLRRAPRPATTSPYVDGHDSGRWYKTLSAPPGEEVDWLSPITSCYSLCATKSGKVVCWDVRRDVCLAEWDPQERWELWKCRVEFDVRTVIFTMAKVLQKTLDDRLMEFVLMKLQFFDGDEAPVFSHLATFKTIGVVMNVFLLDPSSRLLSAFVWVASSNTIGLYALLDWDEPQYVFIDTGIICTMSSNWSCILYKEQIVIHSEESDTAYQYFYPISLLRQHIQPSSTSKSFIPSLSARVGPNMTMSAPFIFPTPSADVHGAPSPGGSGDGENAEEPPADGNADDDGEEGDDDESGPNSINPFPYPPWYPESAHFVRQWWPTLATVPRLSCAVVLLADHDMVSHRTRYVLAQHYFKVPLVELDLEDAASAGDDPMMRIWYVSTPFEVVCVLDGVDEDGEDGVQAERPRPLMAVDFGHAVWVEFVPESEVEETLAETPTDAKRLCFVSFPPVTSQRLGSLHEGDGENDEKRCRNEVEGVVRTLAIPDELDLNTVETINIDQSQGAVIISVKEGKIFILCYE